MGHFERRFGHYVSPLALFKSLSIVSAQTGAGVPILHEAPSRHWKTNTTLEAMKFFSKDLYRYMEGEMTIHAIDREWGNELGKTTIIVNDGNLLFSSFAQRTRVRLFGALSTLISEGRWHYGDFKTEFTLTGKIVLIINLATPQYQRHKGELYLTTLGNRMLLLHAWLSTEQQFEAKRNFSETIGLKPPIIVDEVKKRTIKNLNQIDERIIRYSEDYSGLAVRAQSEMYDFVKGLIIANCLLNKRNRIIEDDFNIIDLLRPYLADSTVPDTHRVIEYLKQGRSYKDICNLLGKGEGYKSTISKIAKRSKIQGGVS